MVERVSAIITTAREMKSREEEHRSQRHRVSRDLKIYDAIARRRVTKTKQIFTEDNNYE